MQTLLNEILEEVRPLIGKGKVADYIPALADVPANQLGIAAIPLKFIAQAQIEKIDNEEERREVMANFTGVQFGAAAARVRACALAHAPASWGLRQGGRRHGDRPQVRAER